MPIPSFLIYSASQLEKGHFKTSILFKYVDIFLYLLFFQTIPKNNKVIHFA